MNVRYIQSAFTSLFGLFAYMSNPAVATAQYSVPQCTSVLQQLSAAMKEGAFKRSISLERQFLTYCKEHIQSVEYVDHLSGLAGDLNGDDQHQEALSIANRCLQINAVELSCLFEKASALNYLGRLSEAKAVIEKSLTLGAITEIDVGWKNNLQQLLLQVGTALNERAPASNAQSGTAQHDAAHIGPASVTGDVPCEGSAVGFSIDINGEIDASTVESVSRLFAAYHDKEAKVNGGLKCAPATDRTQFNPAAYGVHYGINSRGGYLFDAVLHRDPPGLLLHPQHSCQRRHSRSQSPTRSRRAALRVRSPRTRDNARGWRAWLAVMRSGGSLAYEAEQIMAVTTRRVVSRMAEIWQLSDEKRTFTTDAQTERIDPTRKSGMHRNNPDNDGLQLVFGAPGQLQSLAGLDHDRTIPSADALFDRPVCR